MWQYLWVTGSDFDGNESDRLVSGGFVALDVIQAGKVFKLAKVKVLSKGGRVVNITNRTVLKTIAKETLKDASIDISCQFVANLIDNLKNEEISDKIDFEQAVLKAFQNIDVIGAMLDSNFGITDGENVKLQTALKCVREILSKLQKDGVDFNSFKGGSWNCFVEVVAALFQYYGFGKGRFSSLDESQQKRVQAALNLMFAPDSDCYKSMETILRYLVKNM